MLTKLIIRNAQRSAKDYLIYLMTMTIISALMFAFHSMIFSEEMKAVYSKIGIFIAIVSVASFLIMFIVIWLVHYMVNFMLEKRSREFGTYQLIGMKKKQMAQLFWLETTLLGFVSLLLGLIPGFLFQKLFINIFYSVLNETYHLTAEFSLWGMLITVGVILLAYLFALVNVRRKFKKMQIRDFMDLDKNNDVLGNEKQTWQKWLTPFSIIYIAFFHFMLFQGKMSLFSTWFFIGGLLLAVYLLYIGLSPFFVNYITKKRKGVYQGANLFILRQLSSKIKTMRFTMGTLTILFSAALLSSTIVMMFGDYQKKEMNKQLKFDVLVFSDQSDEIFTDYLQILQENTELKDSHIYRIYENGTKPVNNFLYKHRSNTYRTDIKKDGKMGDNTYFGYDTYMSLSDYNRIRGMINLEAIDLAQGAYLLHGKESIKKDLVAVAEQVEVTIDQLTLSCQEIRTESLSQEGMNGADYILVVQDKEISKMTAYYSLLAASLGEKVPANLQDLLKAQQSYLDVESNEELYEIEVGRGSSQVLSWADNVLVAENVIRDSKFVITAVCFVLAYLGIVFLCTAITILAVQQLSDSSKYQFRYQILKQLGMSKKSIRRIIFKQLASYYICPLIISIALSMFTGLFVSERFVYFTGIDAGSFQYYLFGVLLFVMIYIAYFIVSYVGFVRNIEK